MTHAINDNKQTSWGRMLAPEFEQPYFIELKKFVENEYAQNVCFPPKNEIFAAFRYTPFEKVKVVILGQDPYHGEGQAHGLSFSVREGNALPPSLKNIFEELKNDLNIPVPANGDLTKWADQGVFLLNSTLTVRAHMAGSHQRKGWETFTDRVIQLLSEKCHGLVFLLWGGYAKKKAKLIDASKHHVLMTGHPSPLSANRGYWFGNKHFSKTNQFLTKQGETPIIW